MDFPLEGKGLQPRRDGRKKKRGGHNIKAGDAATIGRATLISMIGMLLAKLTGFARELLIVPKFGYGIFSDAYINAFQIPDLIYELLIGGAVAAVLTPHLSSGIERGRERESWRSVSVFISVALAATAICLLFAEILAGPLMGLITGSYRADAAEELKQMSQASVPVMRILLLQTLLMTLVAMAHGILSAYKRFTPVALGPSVYNFFYMSALILYGAASGEGIRKVAWGVVGAALIYFIYQAFAARRELRYFHFSLNTSEPGFRKLVKMALPTLISGSVLHVNSIIMNAFANGLETSGAVTSIRQCITTWSLPYAIFAVSIGSVMLPNLSGFVAANQDRKVRSLYSSSLRRALFMVLPFAIGFYSLRFETIRSIFQWNPQVYTDLQVGETASVLKWFCISMVAQTIVFITNQAFYARKITRLALLTGIAAFILNPVFCALFVNVMNMGMEGIGLAHAVYSVLTALLLYTLYFRHRRSQRPYRMTPFFLRIFFCGGLSALTLFALKQIPFYPSGKIIQLAFYALKLGLGILTYYLAGISIQLHEAVRLQSALRRRLGLAPVEELERISR